MTSKISEGIKIEIEAFHQPDMADSTSGGHPLFYRIILDNCNAFPVKILEQRLYLIDNVSGQKYELEDLPLIYSSTLLPSNHILNQGGRGLYSRGRSIPCEIGRIEGTFVMENLNSKEYFEVIVPSVDFVTQFKNN